MIGKIFPKISTRGFYDLKTGKTMKNVCDARKRGLKKTYEINFGLKKRR